jgi:hypothetical protein
MEKRKPRNTKKVKEKAKQKAATQPVEAPGIQPDHHVESSGGGITEALRHQDELVEEKADEKV